jgi:hypothetical protein
MQLKEIFVKIKNDKGDYEYEYEKEDNVMRKILCCPYKHPELGNAMGD